MLTRGASRLHASPPVARRRAASDWRSDPRAGPGASSDDGPNSARPASASAVALDDLSTKTELFSLEGKRIWIAGERGMAGAAIARAIGRAAGPGGAAEGAEIVSAPRARVDAADALSVRAFFDAEAIDVVVLAAAKVGGIVANATQPVAFLRENLEIATSVISEAHRAGVQKLLFLGSSCIYPREASQPMSEDALLTGPLEPTNEWYAVAKIAGLKLAQAYRAQFGADFITVMPTNLFGPGDNFHPEHSHVPAALLDRFHRAKVAGDASVVVWGSGAPRREFMHVDDFAEACLFALRRWSDPRPINIGVGEDVSIAEFAGHIREAVGFEGDIEFDRSRPDGAPRKLLDVSRLQNLGWTGARPLSDGLADYYRWYVENEATLRR